MGTKTNPGQFDCYAKAADDEELFTLRAKDPSMPYLVDAWVALRRGDWLEAILCMTAAMTDPRVIARSAPETPVEKFDEASSCADRARRWHDRNMAAADAKPRLPGTIGKRPHPEPVEG